STTKNYLSSSKDSWIAEASSALCVILNNTTRKSRVRFFAGPASPLSSRQPCDSMHLVRAFCKCPLSDGVFMAEFSIDRYLNIRAAHAPSFSPDGRFVTFLTNITGIGQLWQLPIEGGWPTQLTFTNESVRAAHYSPLRHELIFSMDAGGNERTQLYRL